MYSLALLLREGGNGVVRYAERAVELYEGAINEGVDVE